MTYVTVARTSDIRPGEVKNVETDDYELAICNVNGSFYCIENTCTHDGGRLDQGSLAGEIIECPRHGARFNVITGDVVRMPAVTPVETYPVKVEGGNIMVDLD